MNKEEVSALIDKLADKTLSFGCETELGVIIGRFRNSYWKMDGSTPEQSEFTYHIRKKGSWIIDKCASDAISNWEVYGHPVLIGDVLEKMKDAKYWWSCDGEGIAIVNLWRKCGYSKSFQEICRNIMFDLSDDDRTRMTRQLGKTRLTNNKIKQDLFARALAESLLAIFKE